jgi:hypothetical protein
MLFYIKKQTPLFYSHCHHSQFVLPMAEEWKTLFLKTRLSQIEIDKKEIFTHWAIKGPVEFLNSFHEGLLTTPYWKEFQNVIVRCQEHSDGHCQLVLRGNSEIQQKFQFILKLTNEFMHGTDLRESRSVVAFYRWNGPQLEIKLQQPLSPEMDFQNNTELALLVIKPNVVIKDLHSKMLRLPQANLRDFYDTCNLAVKVCLDIQQWFTIQVYPPGMFHSVAAEMCSKKGVSGLIEECSLIINISKIVDNYNNTMKVGDTLTVKYQWLAGKLELVFLTGPEHPNLSSLLQGPVVTGA